MGPAGGAERSKAAGDGHEGGVVGMISTTGTKVARRGAVVPVVEIFTGVAGAAVARPQVMIGSASKAIRALDSSRR